MKVEITKAQLQSIIDAADDMEAMLGNGENEPDKAWKKIIRNIDRFLESNGYQRKRKG